MSIESGPKIELTGEGEPEIREIGPGTGQGHEMPLPPGTVISPERILEI